MTRKNQRFVSGRQRDAQREHYRHHSKNNPRLERERNLPRPRKRGSDVVLVPPGPLWEDLETLTLTAGDLAGFVYGYPVGGGTLVPDTYAGDTVSALQAQVTGNIAFYQGTAIDAEWLGLRMVYAGVTVVLSRTTGVTFEQPDRPDWIAAMAANVGVALPITIERTKEDVS